MQTIHTSLIQSDFSGDDHGNFEAVIKIGDGLYHYFRDNSNTSFRWKPGQAIVEGGVAFPGAIIQSDFSSDEHGNFEVVVPLRAANGNVELWHFFHDNSDVSLAWQQGQRITGDFDRVAGSAAIIQSDFSSDEHGNFEVVVPLRAANGNVELWHFFHDNSDVGLPWQRGQRITGDSDRVAFPAAIIQSDFSSDEHGNFEVIVPLWTPDGNVELRHFFHDNSDVGLPWQRGQRITDKFDRVAGPGAIIQSDFSSDEHGNFEVVIPLKMPHGHVELRHFFHDNSDVSLPWWRGQMITASANGAACIIQSDFSSEGHGNFEVLVEECSQSIVHYWHQNSNVALPWLRGNVLLDGGRLVGEVPVSELSDTRKIVQLTGQSDLQGWAGPGSGSPPALAHNRTESRFGIRGTDLGVSFVHKNRLYFLFGDTWRNPIGEEGDLDTIAFCTDTNPDDGLDLTFHKQPPLIGGGISQRGFEVPLDGVSVFGRMFVFFSTDHYKVGGSDIMGRSVVTSSDNDGYDFTYLYDFSIDKFINVSIEVVNGADIGLRTYGATLLIWGSGRYRSSDVYLAAMPLQEIASGRFIRYYAGHRDQQPVWSHVEADAVPLFCSGSVGELSARWNPFIQRWIVLYNSDNPGGIVMRTATSPFGPYSGPVMVFDAWKHGGYGKFIHVSWDQEGQPHDSLYDNMFGPSREREWGGAYGPYQIAPLAKGEVGHFTQIYFTMSTWNPYQVMLMTTKIQVRQINRFSNELSDASRVLTLSRYEG